MDNTEQDKITYAIIQTTLQQCKESFVESLLYWEKDYKKLGLIVRILRHSFLYMMILWYFYIHVISPSFFSLLLFYIVFLIAWSFYLFSYAFEMEDLEQKWTGSHDSLFSNLLEIFHIPLTQSNGIVILSTTIIAAMLTCEIISWITY